MEGGELEAAPQASEVLGRVQDHKVGRAAQEGAERGDARRLARVVHLVDADLVQEAAPEGPAGELAEALPVKEDEAAKDVPNEHGHAALLAAAHHGRASRLVSKNLSVRSVYDEKRTFIILRELRRYMKWGNLTEYVRALEEKGELLRISTPVDLKFEVGCIADYLVKRGGPAVIFDQPRLSDGTISKFPLAMNLYGTRERTNMALGVTKPREIGDRMVALMKPDIGAILRAPWKGINLALEGMSMAPKKIKRGVCQQVVIENPDMTKLPIPTTWPLDGGPFITLPLVVTKDPNTGIHNMGMYRSQVFGPKEVGLHWQAHKHGADHAEESRDKMPVAICLGGPPEVMFSAISPLPDNLSEYEFAGLLGKKRLKIVKCKTNDLWVPAECDFVIEGYTVPGETRLEGPFGDHFGHYSLSDQYPVMHITKITHRKDPIIPMTIVGVPPMEDGYLGEAIGDAFRPVLLQWRMVILEKQ